jgi:hypothetical protein
MIKRILNCEYIHLHLNINIYINISMKMNDELNNHIFEGNKRTEIRDTEKRIFMIPVCCLRGISQPTKPPPLTAHFAVMSCIYEYICMH